MDSKTIRYNNTRILVDQVGGISNFANKINKGQSQTSQFAGSTPIKGIGNKVAREIEEAFGKPHGWLDVIHQEEINYMFSKDLDCQSFNKDDSELEQLISSLQDLNAKGKLSNDLIKIFQSIINLVN